MRQRRYRLWAGALALAVAITCFAHAQDGLPITDPTQYYFVPKQVEDIIPRIQDNLTKMEGNQRMVDQTDKQRETFKQLADEIVDLFKKLLTARTDQALKLYDDDDLRDRLGAFPEAPRAKPFASEDEERKNREKKKPIIAETLRTGVPWRRFEKQYAEAGALLQTLTRQVRDLVEKRRLPDRIREWIRQLYETEEERVFAIGELRKLGGDAVPPLVDMYLKSKNDEERKRIVHAMGLIGFNAVPPLLAALDSGDESLKLAILDVMRRRYPRYDRLIVPSLWYPSAAKTEPEAVRASATRLLSDLLGLPPARLPSAPVALTREADRYFKGEVRFDNPRAVPVWRWTGKELVRGWPGVRDVTPNQAEEYFGIRFARQALLLDPANQAAEKVLLGLVVEKAAGREDPADPLTRLSPGVTELLGRSPVSLLLDLLDRALRERRTGLALSLVRALGNRSEPQALKPMGGKEGPLARALYYPSPRVQQAAAEALLRTPGTPAMANAARVVAVLGRALAPAGESVRESKVLLALGDPDWRAKVSDIVQELGAQPIGVSNDRDAIRELRRHGDIQAVLLDSTLSGSGLANTLAQLRQGADLGHVPVLLAAVPNTRTAIDSIRRYREIDSELKALRAALKPLRDQLRQIDVEQQKELVTIEKEFAQDKRASKEERETAVNRTREKFDGDRQRAKEFFPREAAREAEEQRLQKQLDLEIRRYNLEIEVRRAALERFVRGNKRIVVVTPDVFSDSRALEDHLALAADLGEPVPKKEERRATAERAAAALASLSDGAPGGYDVRPVAGEILAALREGHLGDTAQEQLIRIASRVSGGRAQRVLATVALDERRPLTVRGRAVEALTQNVQRHGLAVSRADIESLMTLAATPRLLPDFKRKLDSLLGVLVRGTSRSTGNMLKEYRPTPSVPAAK